MEHGVGRRQNAMGGRVPGTPNNVPLCRSECGLITTLGSRKPSLSLAIMAVGYKVLRIRLMNLHSVGLSKIESLVN
jgi:hypothetical protein